MYWKLCSWSCGLSRFKILLVGADVAVGARLESAHEPEALRQLVLEEAGPWNEPQKVGEYGHLRVLGGELVGELYVWARLLKPRGGVVDHLFDEVGDPIHNRLSERCQWMEGA